MNLGLNLGLGSANGAGGGASAPTYVFLGSTLTAAPALSGVPAGSTYLNGSETVYVTRNGIKMRATSTIGVAIDNGGFANVCRWQSGNAFNSAEFELAAGTWQVGVIINFSGVGSNFTVINDPAGAANVRQSIPLGGTGASLSDTDGTTYTNAGTAIADVVAGMTLVPALVTDRGGGVGVLRIYADIGTPQMTAIALVAP